MEIIIAGKDKVTMPVKVLAGNRSLKLLIEKNIIKGLFMKMWAG